MKKVFLLLLVALAAVYGTGRWRLGESGAMTFLTKMESSMSDGDAEQVCAMFHEDLEVDIADSSGESMQRISGGKKELCDLTNQAVAGLALLPHAMEVSYSDVAVTRSWLHPWTSEVSYLENRSFTIPGADVTMRTV